MKLKWVFYFFFGLVGLSLRLSFPASSVDFWVLTLCLSYGALGLFPTVWLLFFLSFFYQAFSSAPWWQWWLPSMAVLAIFHLIQRRFYLNALASRAWLILSASAGLYLWDQAFLILKGWPSFGLGEYFKELAVTAMVGMILLPLGRWWLLWVWRRLPKGRSRMGELPWYKARWNQPLENPSNRRPFGFERGI